MPEEAKAPATEQETPLTAPEAPVEAPSEETQPTPDEAFQKRYEDLRPQYDRTVSENAELRQLLEALSSDDPELRGLAAEALGIQLQEEEQLELDEAQQLAQRLDQLEKFFVQNQQETQTHANQEAEIDFLDAEMTALEEAGGFEFTEAEVKTLASLADRLRTDEGAPDVRAAFSLLEEAAKEVSTRQVKSKKAPQVQTGAAGEPELDFKDENARVAAMAEIMRQQAE